jgi:hypothetical protein
VTGTLEVTTNDRLADLSGLGALTSAASLLISSDNGLTSLAGLGALTTIKYDVVIAENAALENLDGFGPASMSTLRVSSNPKLVHMVGLQLSHPTRTVVVSDNPSLLSIQGLEGVTSLVGGGEIAGAGIWIGGASLLRDLSGLQNLVEADSVFIFQNQELENVFALSSLGRVWFRLDIEQNPHLPTCQAENLSHVALGATVTIESNYDAAVCN